MKRFSNATNSARNVTRALARLIILAALRASFAAGEDSQSRPATIAGAKDASAQIECTTPDGRVVAVSSAAGANKGVAALLTDNQTLSCPLQEGRTTFVIKLPATSLRDRFTFVNENYAAAGEMKISVSNDQLPATSTKWVEVDGNITFSHKRLFSVSMVGLEARYMKLSFDVAKGVRLAAIDL